jgi:hypothetical protein
MVTKTFLNTGTRQHRLLIGTPTLGTIRIEWHNAMSGLVIPCNWGMASTTPIGFLVADGQNLIAHEVLQKGFEWVLFIEDDTIPPVDLLLRLQEHIEKRTVPIVSGLYHVKGGTEPMIYRGRGTGAYKDWKPGQQVWADGVPTGCLLVHCSILAELAKTAQIYTLLSSGVPFQVKRIFESPRRAYTDPATGGYMKLLGTSDLYFCDQVMQQGILAKAGWPKVAKREFPFLVDTRIVCSHVDRETGRVW